MYERTERIWDPDLRKEILIVYRREEWIGSGRYIILGQNFVVNNDRSSHNYNYHHTSYEENYIPISDVYVVEEGVMNNMDHSYHSSNYDDDSVPKYQTEEENEETKLHAGEYLSPGNVMNSPNRRFFLVLTNDCEILIFRHNEEEDTIIWSSDTFLGGLSSQCFLALHGSQLVLFAGMDSSRITGVIWSSPNSAIVPGGKGVYFASLDNDGALAIYRTTEIDAADDNFYQHEYTETYNKKNGPMEWLEEMLESSIRMSTHDQYPQYHSNNNVSTKASQAWDSVRQWTLSRLKNRKKSNSNSCVWATGPFGCLNSGRKAIIIGSSIRRSIVKAFVKVDSALDKFIESLGDDNDDDADVLDTLGRVLGQVRAGIGNTGKKMAKRGLLEGKMMTRVVRDTVRERFRRWTNN